ncbi:ATP synthase F1 subcomplex delta subunit [Belliella buryatensis]|uniref:ATP synthase subunit delta n=1 Tax=Belliella buryatensis TaxID=1500549 RepID=A0A239BMN3_9BACT|nr:ATP synthase F1 subunit delta [Belliella buryatensis]SNS08651.1 ATP synthase F1 subcomplex delta subunit [Belliella buryatensis]
MSEFRVSTRYAKSILELSIEKGVLEEVLVDMKQLSVIAATNHELVLCLKSPIITFDKKLKVMKALFDKTGNALTLAFFEIVARKNRADLLVDIAREFQKQYNLHMGIQVADVTTTFPITDEMRNKFISVVKDISGLDKVELNEKIDADIIGGFVLKVNDRQLDESLSSKLRALKLEFSYNHYESKI